MAVFVILALLFWWAVTPHTQQLQSYQAAPTILPTSQPSPLVQQSSLSQYITSSPIATPSSDPKVDCIGPDGKHLQVTQKECDSFNNAWKTSPTPTPQQDSHLHCSYGSCTCNDGYQMNYSNNQCEPCPAHSTGSFGSCMCDNGYQKNFSSGQCVPCPANSYGSFGSCVCNDGYKQNFSTGTCDKP